MGRLGFPFKGGTWKRRGSSPLKHKILNLQILLDITPTKKLNPHGPSLDRKPHNGRKIFLIAFRQILPKTSPARAFSITQS